MWRPLDSLGYHRANCSRAGVCWGDDDTHWSLLRPEFAGESPPTCFAGLESLGHQRAGPTESLPAFHGAQLAIDTTLVYPLRADGVPHRRCADESGAAFEAARRRKDRTYPELSGESGRAKLVVLAGEIGGRFSEEALSFLRTLGQSQGPTDLHAFASSDAAMLECTDGGPCWLAPRLARSLLRCSIGDGILGRMATLQQFLTCSGTSAGLLLRWPECVGLPC